MRYNDPMRYSDPNRWVFFGRAWAATIATACLSFGAFSFLVPPPDPPVLEASRLRATSKRSGGSAP